MFIKWMLIFAILAGIFGGIYAGFDDNSSNDHYVYDQMVNGQKITTYVSNDIQQDWKNSGGQDYVEGMEAKSFLSLFK